ncbi:MAG: hypothetical protein HVN34_10690 [Methanobacteriaceae archaeon]|nr:hypothetical protein [Methanobacteriaceae archaeon]
MTKHSTIRQNIATSIYTCGPAALATILKKLGIYATEAELSQKAGTDYTRTCLMPNLGK